MSKRAMVLDGKRVWVDAGFYAALTPGVCRREGVFETVLCTRGVPVNLDAHLERFRRGQKALGFRQVVDGHELWRQAAALLAFRPLVRARVRWMVWRERGTLHTAVTADAYRPPCEKVYRDGFAVRAVRFTHVRNVDEAWCKSLDYDRYARAGKEAQAAGFDEALLWHPRHGFVEGARTNVFFVRGKEIWTPPLASGALAGTMRCQAVRFLRAEGWRVREAAVHPEDLETLKAVFLTNALLGIMPVGRIFWRKPYSYPTRLPLDLRSAF